MPLTDPFYEPSTGKTYASIQAFREAYAFTSFGELDTEEERNLAGLYSVVSEVPEYDYRMQVIVEVEPEVVGNHLHRRWVVQAAPNEHIIESVRTAVQERLDAFAQTRGYDGILSAASYATSTKPRFAAEGQYAVEARDATWEACYQIMEDVLAGRRPLPHIEEVLAELPELTWPSV